MLKIIENFAEAIDLQRSKVVNGPKKVTIFGGKTENPDSELSQRGTFLLLASKLADSFIVPEHIKSWNHFDTYKDLLSFEEDICAIVDGVLVFLETAGAIAELGCLVKNPDIAPKLIVVVNSEHDQDSFIHLGMLKYLDEAFADVNVIFSVNGSLGSDESAYISTELQRRFADMPKTETFRVGQLRHLLFLLVDFVELIQVARISDIQHLLKCLRYEIPKARLEQLLFVLKNLGFINEKKILGERCLYVDIDSERPEIEYAFSGSPAKKLSWKANFFEQTTGDRWRKHSFKVLRSTSSAEKSEVQNAA
ncbi:MULTISPECIES: retron St85 family effector protein [Herbaspirillum]|uniref:retron St85 family effector protein n=1 Tax=Herbaspirillum TaxID=963 RepID=UPI0015858E4B|nr:hypothetical protein [Herbaspirillum sp. C9C3]